MNAKPVTDLTMEDLTRIPVWEYEVDGETRPGRDETWVVPVPDLPVASLSNRVIGVRLSFGGQEVVGLLGNIDLNDPLASREFATLSVWRDGAWFHLARYFDIEREQYGPEQFAEFLGLPVSEVFPVRYDLSGIAVGHPEVVRGRIDAEPEVRLSSSQRMALIFGQ
jgi:hypothetical protein